jgi:hypothetical protein
MALGEAFLYGFYVFDSRPRLSLLFLENSPPGGDGEALEHALTKSFRIRNGAMKSLCSSVRRFRDAPIREECKSDYPHALQALWKALVRAEDLIQN